ncbi:hypothetical protein L7F22_012839 [Adiantum nelumboides]|nr:hypothetical protein [Adiantum nelumboides]
MRLAEPVAFTLCFPFIGDMLWDLKATTDRGQVGMYAGIVESAFAAVQTLTVLQWGRASDKLGRRPIIVSGLIGSSISTLLFGLSKSFWFLVAARCLNGALNGNVVPYWRDGVDRSLQRCQGLLAVAAHVGRRLLPRPAIGGYLSRPALRYPHLFAAHGSLGFNGLWEEYPYFLPCVVSACITWISVLLGVFFLEETLPSKVQAKREKLARKKAAKAAQEQRDEDQSPLLGSSSDGRARSSSPTSYGATAASPRPDGTVPSRPLTERSPERLKYHRSLRESLLDSFRSHKQPQSAVNGPTAQGDSELPSQDPLVPHRGRFADAQDHILVMSKAGRVVSRPREVETSPQSVAQIWEAMHSLEKMPRLPRQQQKKDRSRDRLNPMGAS